MLLFYSIYYTLKTQQNGIMDILKKTQIYLVFFAIVVFYAGMYLVLKDAGDAYKQNINQFSHSAETTSVTTAKLPKKSELFVTYWYADWCGPCNQMKPHWRHKTVVDQLKKYKGTKSGKAWKPYKVDIDLKKNQGILKKYKVNGIPCIILMDNSGKEWGRSVGYKSQSQLRAFLLKGPVWPKEK